jgi:phosphoenolpyruvate---glycerone phosphotransferase subunit DhaK
MSRRQLLNAPDDLVAEALEGLELTHPGLLRRDPEFHFVQRRQPATGKVGLVSGGGSGHEPLHAGFVGTGMLDVAVAGAVFASPTALQIQAGTVAADSGRGVLQIVKNYTGDVLNFQIAAEIADDDDIAVESVLVDDDIATSSEQVGPGRRGTAAVVIVEKVCGAAAEAGADLPTLAALGRRVVGQARTLSLALDACTHPGDSTPAFELPDDLVEFGVGIHGERGVSRIPFAPGDELVSQLVEPVVAELELARGDAVIAIVNGLGSTYPLQLSLAARRMHHLLGGRGITVARSLVGSYVTSLDMNGFSVTLVRADDELVRLWDAPVRTATLCW